MNKIYWHEYIVQKYYRSYKKITCRLILQKNLCRTRKLYVVTFQYNYMSFNIKRHIYTRVISRCSDGARQFRHSAPRRRAPIPPLQSLVNQCFLLIFEGLFSRKQREKRCLRDQSGVQCQKKWRKNPLKRIVSVIQDYLVYLDITS